MIIFAVYGCPFDIPCVENKFFAATRDTVFLKYKEKKKSRRFDEKIRYASCKERADSRKHVKGRFVKTGDPYEYMIMILHTWQQANERSMLEATHRKTRTENHEN